MTVGELIIRLKELPETLQVGISVDNMNSFESVAEIGITSIGLDETSTMDFVIIKTDNDEDYL
ncbi:hypothetical protein HCB27_16795 [Listeria booriae]|uniref:Uncharacterized protein n=1 Tax=Listeria booriae TaxID=1552123 RepID=A0A7X0Z8Z4_9LIST|nr:hypothetical protein [Listeria booriae]MBC2178184.1 hypothetical protein [Listeria booriae]MBC2178289.1 hypothetical protein [Listeria booriae]